MSLSCHRQGVALQLCYLRYPGCDLARGETIPVALLAMVARRLKTTPALWDQYASRDQTRREHQQEVVQRLGLTLFTRSNFRELVTLLIPTTLRTIQGIVLEQSFVEEIRVRRPMVPTVRVLELVAAHATTSCGCGNQTLNECVGKFEWSCRLASREMRRYLATGLMIG